MKTKNIKQIVIFKASPNEVYEALMDSKKHSRFTGQAAKISREVGGKFTTFDGYAEGKNLELKPDKKIVQEWRASNWDKGHYSKITFLLEPKGKGTKLTFTHIGVPEDDHANISDGWNQYYWEPMKEMFDK